MGLRELLGRSELCEDNTPATDECFANTPETIEEPSCPEWTTGFTCGTFNVVGKLNWILNSVTCAIGNLQEKLTLGLVGEIPFINGTEDDFQYEQTLKYDAAANLLQAENITTVLNVDTSEAFGLNASTLLSIQSTALGSLAVSSYDSSTTIGYNANNTIESSVVIGTNALTSEDLNLPNLGTVIIGDSASGPRNSVILGNNAEMGGFFGGVVIGNNAYNPNKGVTIGTDAVGGVGSDVTIGEQATSTSVATVAVGADASSGLHGTAIGASASATKNYDIAVGSASETLLSDSAAFGYLAVAGVDFTNELVFGGEDNLNQVRGFEHIHFGQGVIGFPDAIPKAVDMRTTDGNGTDIAGADFTISAGRGTGAADGGALTFGYAPAGVTGAVRNPLVDAFEINNLGEIESLVDGAGIVLRSPDSSRWRITVDNAGVLSAAAA